MESYTDTKKNIEQDLYSKVNIFVPIILKIYPFIEAIKVNSSFFLICIESLIFSLKIYCICLQTVALMTHQDTWRIHLAGNYIFKVYNRNI